MTKKDFKQNQVMDLTGPEGNAFCLIGTAMKLAKLKGETKAERADLMTEMTSGNYEKVVQVFEREFGNFVTLLR